MAGDKIAFALLIFTDNDTYLAQALYKYDTGLKYRWFFLIIPQQGHRKVEVKGQQLLWGSHASIDRVFQYAASE